MMSHTEPAWMANYTKAWPHHLICVHCGKRIVATERARKQHRQRCALNGDASQQSVAEFMERTRGIQAWSVARALSSLTQGINWTGCSRGHMAERWAKAQQHADPQRNDGSAALKKVSLDQLCERIRRFAENSIK